MKRLKNSLKTDFLFQFKEGFFYIYLALCIVYLLILSIIPANFLNIFIPVLIFTDPAGVGLFFIGGILMLEKRQGSINYILVTPLKIKEYIYSKIITLTFLAICVSVIIALFSNYNNSINYLFLVLGIISTSILFTYLGIVISTKCSSLNEYFIKVLPWMFIFTLPCFSIINKTYGKYFSFIPSVAGFRIIYGSFNSFNNIQLSILTLYIFLINILLFNKVVKIFEKSVFIGGLDD
ncbi:MAG: ABC transporter permease [Bacillota bacterium]